MTKHELILKAVCALLLANITIAGFADSGPDVDPDELLDMSLEELLDVRITSVSKRKEKLHNAAAAIYVVTQEDLRRSGVTNIPEALRMVPGLAVARLDANKWSVTSRGFSGRFANKLLVLIDGRTVYTPLFSGVEWEARDVMIDDIDRIEVIRGSGGALWGANAVNGVINIVMKDSEETQGGLFSVRVGTEERTQEALRYGAQIGDNGYYRVYAKYMQRDEAVYESGKNANDDWETGQGGFRIDWNWNDENALTLQGDIYSTNASQTNVLLLPRFPYSQDAVAHPSYDGGNLLARWTHLFPGGTELQFQTYYERAEYKTLTIKDGRDTFDIDLQVHQEYGNRHHVVWGAGFRYIQDHVEGTYAISLDSDRRRDRLFTAFFQDEITLIEDRLRATLGAKFEHNDYTGFEIQPTARLAWTPSEQTTLWGSVSRAIRTPSRTEYGSSVTRISLPFLRLALQGNEDFESEELVQYEIGWRRVIADWISLDTAVFYNDYDHLRTLEMRLPRLELSPLSPQLTLPIATDNNMEANAYGLEVGLDLRPRPWWRSRLSYTLFELDTKIPPRSLDFLSASAEGDTPSQQAYLWNGFDLTDKVQLDVTLRYVGELPAYDVREYLTMDIRLAWQPSENLELEIVGQNLFDGEHFELKPSLVDTQPTQVERGVYGQLTWKF